MIESVYYRIAADLVLTVHTAFVLFGGGDGVRV
jgi:hypothetical protein